MSAISIRPAIAPLIALCLLAPGRAGAGSREFVALEDRLSDALASYDATTVAALWDDDFVFVFPNGHISHRAERLAGLKRPPAGEGAALSSHNDAVEVQYEDAKLAVVTVRSSWRSHPTDPGDPYLATHVWVRRGDTWRLLSAQVAHLEP